MFQSTFAAVMAARQRIIMAMLLNPRVVTAALAAVAVVAGCMLGPNIASAGWSTSLGNR
jgi:hypothetical protein